jgi:hypothetical protein
MQRISQLQQDYWGCKLTAFLHNKLSIQMRPLYPAHDAVGTSAIKELQSCAECVRFTTVIGILIDVQS